MQVFPDAQVAADLRQVLVREDFIGGQVVVPPAEVRRGRGLDAGAGGAGDGLHVHVAPEEAGLRQRQERQLDGRREAARIGHFLRAQDPVPVQLRESIDIAVGFVAEVLGQVHDLEPCRAGMFLPEGAALAMGGTQEKDINPFQVDDVGKDEVGVAHEAGVVFRHGLPRLALGMDPGDFGRRMVHQQPDQFAGGIAGAPDDTRADHASSPGWWMVRCSLGSYRRPVHRHIRYSRSFRMPKWRQPSQPFQNSGSSVSSENGTGRKPNS